MSYITSYSFPLRFKENCDVESSSDETVLSENIKLSLMVSKNGIPLFPLGASIQYDVFDMNDDVFKNYMGYKIREEINNNVANVVADKNTLITESEHTVTIVVPYHNRVTNKPNITVLDINRIGTDK